MVPISAITVMRPCGSGGMRGTKNPESRSPRLGALRIATRKNTTLISPTRKTSAFWMIL